MNKEIRIVMTSESALSDGVVGSDQINELLNALNETNGFKITHIIESLNTKYRINIAVLDLEAQELCSDEYDNKTYTPQDIAAKQQGQYYGGVGVTSVDYVR